MSGNVSIEKISKGSGDVNVIVFLEVGNETRRTTISLKEFIDVLRSSISSFLIRHAEQSLFRQLVIQCVDGDDGVAECTQKHIHLLPREFRKVRYEIDRNIKMFEAPEYLRNDLLHVKLKKTLMRLRSRIKCNFHTIHDTQQYRKD